MVSPVLVVAQHQATTYHVTFPAVAAQQFGNYAVVSLLLARSSMTRLTKVTLPATTVTLIVPGLSGHGSTAAAPAEQATSVPVLAAWPELNWRSCERLPWETVLLRALGLSSAAPGAAPASIGYRSGAIPGDSPNNPEKTAASADGLAVCADPVHMQVDLDDALLIPSEALQLSVEEVLGLQASINELLSSDGLSMQMVENNPCRWLLSGLKPHEVNAAALDPRKLDTWPTHAVARRNISQYLPSGESGAGWRRLMTELQMLLHAHPVNEQRQLRGLLPVNGVWLWGGAVLPEKTIDTSVRLVSSDTDVIELAKAMGIRVENSKQDMATTLTVARSAGESILVVDLGYYNAWLAGDSEAMQFASAAIETNWLLPVKSAVRARVVSRFAMDTAEGYQAFATSKAGRWSLLSRWTGR